MTIRVTISHDEPESSECLAVQVFDGRAARVGPLRTVGPGEHLVVHVHSQQSVRVTQMGTAPACSATAVLAA